MAKDSSHDYFSEFLPAIVTYPKSEVSPHAISLVEETIKQLLLLGSSLVVVAANLIVRPNLLHEAENHDHKQDHVDHCVCRETWQAPTDSQVLGLAYNAAPSEGCQQQALDLRHHQQWSNFL
jgi:hypothetical protein